MTWNPTTTIPRTGEQIVIAIEVPEETFEGVHYPRSFEHYIVSYKASPFSHGKNGPFVWRQKNGDTIAEFVPCAWKKLEEFEGW